MPREHSGEERSTTNSPSTLPSARSAVTGEPRLQGGSEEPLPAMGKLHSNASIPRVRGPETLQAAPAFLAHSKPMYGAVRGNSRCPLSPLGFRPEAWPGLKGNKRRRAVNLAVARASLARLSAQPPRVGLRRVRNSAAKLPSAPRGEPAVVTETQRDSTQVPAARLMSPAP